jgi:predicted RNA-binding Zn-ribbon protein involved in translation (DUF1610 family)
MGSEFNTRTYEGKLSKDKVELLIQDTIQEMSYESGHGYSGTWVEKDNRVDFCSTIFTSEDKASDWLIENNEKWGNIGACYFEEKQGTPTQNNRIKAQQLKVYKAKEKIREFYSDTFHKIKSVKAKTKKCKACGTVHQLANISSYKCPVCHTSMLTATELKKETKLKEKIENEQLKVDNLIAKKGGKIRKGVLAGGWCSS